MKEHKTSEEQRERMLSYYYSHREEILEQKRKERVKERQHKQEQMERIKRHKYNSRLIQMYESWNLYILERLETNKIPKWVQRGMILQIQHNNDMINLLEENQYEQSSSTRR